MKYAAADWIRRLQLKPHPEGGYFRETYRSAETMARAGLPGRYKGRRVFGTAIYFLLRGNQCSAFHRLKSDEIWHFYAGAPVAIFILRRNGALKKVKLGLNPAAGEQPQVVVKAGFWFAAALDNPKSAPPGSLSEAGAQIGNRPEREAPRAEKSYALLGCTLAPGFDFADLEMGSRQALCRQFPRHGRLIKKLTPAGKNGN